MNFFDTTNIEWLDLDDFGSVDTYASIGEIPSNREVQYTTPKPAIPMDEESNVDNPCAIEPLEEDGDESSSIEIGEDFLVFHNGIGSMCTEALEFFEENEIEYTEHLTTENDFYTLLNEYKDEFDNTSEGVSAAFSYYPMIFMGDKAFSGFNDTIAEEILELL